MKAERIDRVYVYVKDVVKARDFFGGFLGTEFCEPMEWKQPDAVRTTVCPLGISLIEPRGKDSMAANIIEKRGEGVGFIAIKVPSIEQAIADSKSRGIRLVSTMTEGKYKAALLHPADTFGVMIDICEYNAPHPVLSVL